MTDLAMGRFGRTPFNSIRLALRARGPLAVFVMVCGVLGLITSYLGVDLRLRPLDGRSATHPVTALCLIGLGLAILKTRRFGGKGTYWRLGLLAVILVVCVARMMDAALAGATGGVTAGVFGPIGGFSGRFSIEAAVTLGAFTAAALIRQGNGGRLGGVFLALGLAMVFSTLLELSYGTTFFNGDLGAFTFMGLVATSLSMLSIYLHRPFVRVAFLLGDIGVQTRVMALAILVVPWTGGLILYRLAGIGSPIETAVLAAMTCLMMMILLTTSARHEGAAAARRRAERELAMLSRIDPVTGALNQFGITEVVDGAWIDFRSAGSKYGLILVDLGYFRRLDATFGSGDDEETLSRLAATLQPQLRKTDALGRWGTDEFLILLKIKDVSNMDVVAHRLRAALADASKPFCAGLDVQPATIDVPLGISHMRDGDEGPSQAITRADQNLHLAKQDETTKVPVINSADDQMFIFAEDSVAEFEADAADDAAEGALDLGSKAA